MKGRVSTYLVAVVLLTAAGGALVGCPPLLYREVPNVVGLMDYDAQEAIESAGLVVGIITEAYNNTIPARVVISQSPLAGSSVPKGFPVDLIRSKGPRSEGVPDVVGMTEADARSEIVSAGFSVGDVTRQYSDTTPEGVVMSQSPVGGTDAQPGDPVGFVVSRGKQDVDPDPDPDPDPGPDPDPDPDTILVPDVVGMAEVEAASAIAQAGLVLRLVTEEYSDTVPAGTVMGQEPAAGAKVQPGTPVDLLVSVGAEGEGSQVVTLPGATTMEIVWIPGGSYQMGRYLGEQDSRSDESPQHLVTLPGFWMSNHEVTKAQWEAVMGTRPWASQVPYDHPDTPAVFVSWYDAKEFTEELSALTGKQFRLPSESEWEYACRAGTTTRFYWGDDPGHTKIADYAWSEQNAQKPGEEYAHVVGQKLPNAWGLYDMGGNVWEWCEDDSGSSGPLDYSKAPTDGSPHIMSPRKQYRITRGGSWATVEWMCRSARRGFEHATETTSRIGFRVAR